mmetsp:Transcript_399/g.563  ORF Transcript_399/g.563 Transcript_399/m.563 type:complete len:113 (-) Transcript_399:1004-1342(-)
MNNSTSKYNGKSRTHFSIFFLQTLQLLATIFELKNCTGLNIKLQRKENAFVTFSKLSNDALDSTPSVMHADLFSTLTALSFADLSDAISDMHSVSSPLNLCAAFVKFGCTRN